MKFRSVPQIPRGIDPALQAVLAALKENFELMAGQRGAGDFVIDQLGYAPVSREGDVLAGILTLAPDHPACFARDNPGVTTTTPPLNFVVKFATAPINSGGYYDPTTGLFTCPKEGRYLVAAGFMQYPNYPNPCRWRVSRSGNNASGDIYQPNASFARSSTVCIVPCAAGDTLSIVANVGSGSEGSIHPIFDHFVVLYLG